MAGSGLKLAEEFAVLKPDLQVATIQVTPAIYEELDSNPEALRNSR